MTPTLPHAAAAPRPLALALPTHQPTSGLTGAAPYSFDPGPRISATADGTPVPDLGCAARTPAPGTSPGDEADPYDHLPW